MELRDKEFLQILIDAIPIPFFYKDNQGRYLGCNSSFEQHFGVSKEQIIGKNAFEIFPTELAEKHSEKDEEIYQEKGIRSYEAPVMFSDGSMREAMFYKESFSVSPGAPEGLVGVVFDITERKRIERALRESRAELGIRVKVRTAELSKINEELQQKISQFRAAQEELRLSESRYRAIVEDQADLIFRFDTAGLVTFVNEATAKFFGKKPEEFIGKPFLPYVPEEDRQKTLSNIASLNRDNQLVVMEHRVQGADGNLYWQQWTGQAIFDEEGRIIEYQAVGRDITKRKQAEEELVVYQQNLESLVKERTRELEAENLQRKQAQDEASALRKQIEFILGATRTGLDIIDAELNIRYIDPEWQKVYGDPAGKKCYQYFMDRNEACACCGVKKALETKQTVVSEEILLKENNRPIQVTSIPFQDKDGQWMVAEVNVDISERKHAEEKLQSIQRQQQAILDNIPDIAWLKDKESRFIAVNDPFGKACGYKPQEIVGKNDLDLWPKELALLYRNDDQEVMRTGKRKRVEEPFVDSRGNTSWIETIKTPIYDDQKNIIGTTGIARDITERKQIEEELGKYRNHLEKLVKERTAELEKEVLEKKRAQVEKDRLNKELGKFNQRLKQLALRDSATGLYNHRYLTEIIEVELYRAKRYAHPLSVIMLDADYFKSVNDAYGLKFGDMVLKQLARLLRRKVRKYDIAVRFGGEEFVIISPGTDRSTAIVLAQRLLEAVNAYIFGGKEGKVKLKVSLAVATYPEDKVFRGMDLIEMVDKILSKVKEFGGNNVYSSLDIEKGKKAPVKGRVFANSVKFLKERIKKLDRRANQSLVEAVFAFARTIEAKDHYTGEHAENTVKYALAIARALNLPQDDIEHVRQAAMLHDLGKIGISEKILNKKGKLTRAEFEQIKKHTQIGADIIRPIQFFQPIIPLVLYHHERWDGKGYPSGLKSEEIPLGARIVALADVYQALTSDRPYRKALSVKKAMQIIQDGSGTFFDPSLVGIFLKILRKKKNK